MQCVECTTNAVTVCSICGDAVCESHRAPDEEDRVGGMLFRSAPAIGQHAGLSYTTRPGSSGRRGLSYASDGKSFGRGGMTFCVRG